MFEYNYTPEQFDFLKSVKEEILDGCKKGCFQGFNKDRSRCDCLKLFLYVKELYYSGLPTFYWKFSFDSLDEKTDDFFEDFASKIKNAIENSLGVLFYSKEKGTGKTTFLTCIAKEAIFQGYHVFYTTMIQMIDGYFDRDTFIKDRIDKADLIIIDEMDKLMLRENSELKKRIEMNLRILCSRKKSVLMATNSDEEELDKSFNLNDFFKRHFKIHAVDKKISVSNYGSSWGSRLSGDKTKIWNKRNLKKESEKFIKVYKN